MADELIAMEKVKLNRGMNGNYGWEITIVNSAFNEKILKEIDAKLRKTYIEDNNEPG